MRKPELMWPQIWLALVSAIAGAAGEPKYGRSRNAGLPSCCAFSYCSRNGFFMKRSIVDYLAENAARDPGRVAYFFKERKVTYRELEEAAARCRGALAAQGIGPGDRVSLVMSDSPEMVVAFLGIMGAGAIAVPCSTLLPPDGLAYVFKDSEAKLVIVSPEHLQNAKAAGHPRILQFSEFIGDAKAAPLGKFDRDTPCLVLYTSGSTG